MYKVLSQPMTGMKTALAVIVMVLCTTPITAHGPGEKSGVKIIVIGATSRTADELIPQAIWRGHDVVGLARRPQAVRHAAHPNLAVVKADVRDQDSLKAAFEGHEGAVVISVFGSRSDPQEEVAFSDLMAVGVTNIIQAMKTNGIGRIFVTSSASVQEMSKFGYKADTPRPDNLTIRSGLWYYLKRGLYNDMAEMERIVRESSMNYGVLRPGLILIEPPRGNIKAAVNVEAPGQRVITYADFAAFILDATETDAYDNSTIGVYSDRPIEFSDTGINPEALMARQREINRQIREELAGQE